MLHVRALSRKDMDDFSLSVYVAKHGRSWSQMRTTAGSSPARPFLHTATFALCQYPREIHTRAARHGRPADPDATSAQAIAVIGAGSRAIDCLSSATACRFAPAETFPAEERRTMQLYITPGSP